MGNRARIQHIGWSAAGCVAFLFVLAFIASAQSGSGLPAADQSDPAEAEQQEQLMQRYEKMVQYNLDNEHTLPSSLIDSMMVQLEPLPVADRIAAWADYFERRGDVTYLFGLAPEGYVSAGRLVDDFKTDCVLFFYRATELGRSSNAVEAVQFAYGTRFHGALLADVVSDEGRVDYNSPVHLDYSEDIVRSGIWGREITSTLGTPVADQAGTERYAPGAVSYVPKDSIDFRRFQNGDLVFFVSDETTPSGQKVRESGALIGHIGIVRVENGEAQLIHAASKGLPGFYEGNSVVRVPLAVYLERVENWKGILATRIENF
jgi:hypothetical protein